MTRAAVPGGANQEKGKSSFLKKRSKRLFLMLSRTLQAAQTPEFAKVSCYFSSEKKTFLLLLLPRAVLA
jgi:hypothetical protein